MKRIECKTHPKQAITNFCKHSQCYLPLCPECVVLHTAYHRERNWHGEFDTIENTLTFCDSKLEEFEKKYMGLESMLYENLKEVKTEEEFFFDKIDKTKNFLLNSIELLCENLKQDVCKMFKDLINGMTHDFDLMVRELKDHQMQMSNMRKNLDTYPTKTIIELYSTGFVIDHYNFQGQITSFNQHLKEQIVKVEVNDNVLKEIENIMRDRLINFGPKIAKNERGPAKFSERYLNFNEMPRNFNERPINFNERYERPRNDNDRPRNYTERPINFNERPINYNERPINYNERPIYYQERPVNFNERQVNFNERPINFNEGPSNFNEIPINYPGNLNERNVLNINQRPHININERSYLNGGLDERMFLSPQSKLPPRLRTNTLEGGPRVMNRIFNEGSNYKTSMNYSINSPIR